LRNKDSQRTCLAKDSLGLDSSNHAVDLETGENLSDRDLEEKGQRAPSYRFTLEGFPQDRAVKYDKSSFSRAWRDFAWRDIVNVHNANDVVFAVAAPFHVSIKLIFQSVVNIVSEEGWVNIDLAFEVS
jgi:hypothetical protein